ncbi:MAG: glycosyltransferase [Acidobacteriaceae bacterium]|nr:glycosyltransferase [Acidobacteriaceae bacterium]
MPEKLSPILGLPVDEDAPVPSPQSGSVSPLPEAAVEISVIVPARNEALRLPECLHSLLAQEDELFSLGRDWELLLVDDASTDATRRLMEEAAAGQPSVRVLEAPPLDASLWTGKSNACWYAAGVARGRWLVFTDADTIHEPKSLLHALHEARKHHAALLSYSPRQLVHGVAQRVLMPLVFSELASVYRMNEVNDPEKSLAAANGQFLMMEREAYFAVGGHKAIARSVLEDVDLAKKVKQSGRLIRFRYGGDALSTRMYQGVSDMVEGWTKNLALLFPHALQLAAWRVLDILLWCLPFSLLLFPYLATWKKMALGLVWLRTLLRFYTRVARAHMGWTNTALSPLGLPLFVALLVRSWMNHHIFHRVSWKGREYSS